MKHLDTKKGLVAILVGAVLMLAGMACGGNDTPGPGGDPGEKEEIIFSDLNWPSAEIQNRIAMFIAEHGYDYPVNTVFGDTISLWNGLIRGDTHVSMEIWLPNQQEVWDPAIANNQVVPVGKSLDDNWQSAFVVPTYVVEQNPGLKSVADLPEHKDLFTSPESGDKARWITCIPGWECEKVNENKMTAYGLEDVLHPVSPGSDVALFADLEGAYQRQQPWLGYMWGPTVTANTLDLTQLEEPEYNEECWDGDQGCAYPTAEVLIAVHPSLADRAPDFVEFLGKWSFSAEEQVATEAWMSENNATSEEAAIWYLENQQGVWTQWVPADVADKVKAALPS